VQEKAPPLFVILDRGQVLQSLLTRYMSEVDIKSVPSLEKALIELQKVPAQALLINAVSISRMLAELRTVDLPPGTPVMLFSIPTMADASTKLGVQERLVKPVSRDDLLSTFERLGVTTGTVLIVDDEPDALHLFGRLLASSGRDYRVLLARDGLEALAILEERRPDIILLDLVMPNMDGFEVIEQREANPDWREIPIVVASALDPAGQPILSPALAVTLAGGLSTQQLLQQIQVVSQMLSAVGQAVDLEPQEKSDG
jgi:CheY-like chemotaxis protein